MVSETDVMYMSTLQEINTILFFFGGGTGKPVPKSPGKTATG